MKLSSKIAFVFAWPSGRGGSMCCCSFSRKRCFFSVSGGAAGIAMGIVVSAAIPFVLHRPAPVSIAAVVGGFAFAAAVGVFIRREKPQA
jgi:membrane associated rhomboid family serine protease